RRNDEGQWRGSVLGRERPRKGRLDGGQREHVPGAFDAFQLVRTTVLEADTGARDQVRNGCRDPDLRRTGERHHTRADVHCDAAEPSVDLLALARVDADANVKAELLDRRDDRRGGTKRLRGLVERREEAVAARVLLGAALALQLRA